MDVNEKLKKKGFIVSENNGRRPKCSSRNAVMARINRQKKKRFVESLKKDVARLSTENNKLKQTLEGQSTVVTSLRKEINYLKGVLANSTEISLLVKCIQNSGLPVTSSLSSDVRSRKISSIEDHNYVLTNRGDIFSGTGSVHGDNGMKDTHINSTLLDVDESPIVDDVNLCLSMSDSNVIDLPIPSPLFDKMTDTGFYGCSAQPSTFESSLDLPEGDIFPDIGVCLHVCKKRVSLEFCSVCSSNAQSDWDNLDFLK